MSQAMTTGYHPNRLRITLHLLLDRLDRQWLTVAFPIPEETGVVDPLRALSQAFAQTLEGIG
jgi:hypothetical protein